mmetsp:Transcript_6985/g.11742  ORF Transcript_6985/g.11742 Transcript_6985/m.11742 type:complete len:92 (+) Transcript_6985:262-537(+)
MRVAARSPRPVPVPEVLCLSLPPPPLRLIEAGSERAERERLCIAASLFLILSASFLHPARRVSTPLACACSLVAAATLCSSVADTALCMRS